MNDIAGSEIYARSQRLSSKPSDSRQQIEAPERLTIGELARSAGVTLRALRFYQSKGLLSPSRDGQARIYSTADRERLELILKGKRLGFTLHEIREMLMARAAGAENTLPISRRKCTEQINLLERQRRDIERALCELREIYTAMFRAALGRAAANDRG